MSNSLFKYIRNPIVDFTLHEHVDISSITCIFSKAVDLPAYFIYKFLKPFTKEYLTFFNIVIINIFANNLKFVLRLSLYIRITFAIFTLSEKALLEHELLHMKVN